MENVSFSEAGYLLFILPGFVLVWTYRHFSESSKKIGEFEYAAWSFIWGFALFGLLMTSLHFSGRPFPSTPYSDAASLLGSFLGIGVVQASTFALPLGYIGAILQQMGLFRVIDRFFKSLILKVNSF